MFYYSPSVKQCNDRKGKPWRATVYYKDPETKKAKQKTKMLPNAKGKKDAERLAYEWLAELNESKTAKGLPTGEQAQTVSEMIQAYEDYRVATKDIQKSTYKRDLLVTKNYINPYLGDYLFNSVSRDDIRDWLTKLYNKYSATTARNAYTQLKKVYTYYCEVEDYPNNPFKGVKPQRAGKPKVTHLTQEQRNDYLLAVNEDYDYKDAMYCGFLLAFYCGMRRGEICGLRWRNIDFIKREIIIDSSIGYGEGGNYTKPPKTDSSKRTIPIIPQLFEALKMRYDYIKPKPSWFVTGKEDKFMSLQSFTYKFGKLVKDHDLKDYYGKTLTPHCLRHNFATFGMESGIDIASLSLIMGHASRAMTLDVYGDANPDALALASKKLTISFRDESKLDFEEKTEEEIEAIRKKLETD